MSIAPSASSAMPQTQTPEKSFSQAPTGPAPSKPHSGGKDKAFLALEALMLSHNICEETAPLMVDSYLKMMDGAYHSMAERAFGEPEMEAFANSLHSGLTAERRFYNLIVAITKELDCPPGKPKVMYMHNRDLTLFSRAKGAPGDSRFGLTPDFFTSGVEPAPYDWGGDPSSISTILSQPAPAIIDTTDPQKFHQSAQGDAGQPSTSTSSNSDLLQTPCWEDVQAFWDIEGSLNASDMPKVWSNLISKAIEVLRRQWHRQFVLAFLVCGTQMRMFHLSRNGVLVSMPVDFRSSMEGRLTLAKCILAPLVLPHTALGFTIDPLYPQTTEVEGKLRLVIQVGGKDFVLGDQIVVSRKDVLVSRGTTIHMARRMGDQEWNLCYKNSWPSERHAHEGDILDGLQGVEGVVRVVAWDTPPLCDMFSGCCFIEDFKPSSRHKGQQDSEIHHYHSRRPRQVVTNYLPHSVINQQLSLLEMLQVWRDLYLIVDAIADRGWVHRDLSWNNIRLVRGRTSWSVTLIDFDLAAPIMSPGYSGQIGTPMFMPAEMLKQMTECQHQELHGDESVFWIGFLALVNGSIIGKKAIASLCRASLEQLADIKLQMLSGPSQDYKWPSWLGWGPQAQVLREVLSRAIELQFTPGARGLEYVYPTLGEVDNYGFRIHWKRHKALSRKMVEVLETAIGQLREQEMRASMQVPTSGVTLGGFQCGTDSRFHGWFRRD